jgi:hypothetical protein
VLIEDIVLILDSYNDESLSLLGNKDAGQTEGVQNSSNFLINFCKAAMLQVFFSFFYFSFTVRFTSQLP